MSRGPLWLEQLRRARIRLVPNGPPGPQYCDHTHCRSAHRREVANAERGMAAIEFHEQLVRCRMQGRGP